MIERRKMTRTTVDLTVRKHIDGHMYFCRACEISAKGIRLKLNYSGGMAGTSIDIEVPLVQGKLITAVSAKQIWKKNEFEAFEFLGPSFAQSVILERLFGGLSN